MKTWQLLVGLTGMLLLYALLSVLFGYDLWPADLVFGVVFGAVGLYVGDVLSRRLNAGRE
jgi:hypothetical protein